MTPPLDDYSRIAFSMILARFPAWQPFATFIAGPDGSTAVVEFQVPCPSGAVERGLLVATDGGELTVGFHTHHTHFGMFIEDDQLQQIKAGLDHAGDMFDERIGVVSWYCGGCFAGSSSLDLPHPAPLPRLREIFPNRPDCDRITLRSWTGRFDRDED
jgi:hypothetical protein